MIGLLILGIVILSGITVALTRKSGKKKTPRSRDNLTIIRESNRALAQNPKDAHALKALADVYYSEQEWDKAAKTYAILMDLVVVNPEISEHEVMLRHGLSSMQIENLESAYRSLMLARKGHEDLFEINFNLGHLELKRKNYERALNLLRPAHEARPDHLGTTRYLGHTYYRLKRHREAISFLRRVVETEPDDKESTFILGQAYYELSQNDLAGRVFSHLRADPVYGPRAALMAGSLHLKARLYDEAEVDFQIGLRHEEIPPEVLVELKYRLAATYTRKQQLDRAVQALHEIAQINPNYKDVTAQLERNRELAGNKNLQVFLMAPTSEFVGLCRRIVTRYFPRSKSKITDISVGRSEYTDILAEVHTTKWEDVVLFRFVRSSGVVGELVLRDLHARSKEVHAGRGFCICAGQYSEGAQEFVEARLIDLIGKPELAKLLARL